MSKTSYKRARLEHSTEGIPNSNHFTFAFVIITVYSE